MSKKKWEWHDVYLPVDVVKEFAHGDLAPTELKVLVVISALSAGEKKWCWARNRYFAEALGQSNIGHISKSIHSLIQSGFLKSKEKNGRRLLRLSWSWSKPKHPYGKTEGGLRKTVRGLTENRKHEVNKEEVSEKNTPKGVYTQFSRNGSSQSSSSSAAPDSSPDKKDKHTTRRKRAESAPKRTTRNDPYLHSLVKLQRFCVSIGLKWNDDKGSLSAFRRAGERIIKSVDYYCKYKQPDDNSLPDIHSGRQFASANILVWVEDRRKQHKKAKETAGKSSDYIRMLRNHRRDPENFLHPDNML